MTDQEKPIVINVGESQLIGIVHIPKQAKGTGIIPIVAGGPQYRGGCCRQLVLMARELAKLGYPVLRFDYRGLGDSLGDYKGFQHVQEDIDAAILAFKQQIPELNEIILWGGCDAASAAMIHGPNNPSVSGMIIANPWVHTEQTHAKVVVQHYYLNRLKDKTFWLKIFKLRLNFIDTFKSVFSNLKLASQSSDTTNADAKNSNIPYPQRMCIGMSKFQGKTLLMMSGLSLVSKEFDELVAGSSQWKSAIDNPNLERVDFPNADQAFSTIETRKAQLEAAIKWLHKWN